ncbi:hypothetical protein D9M68_820890 [compost metagenome]
MLHAEHFIDREAGEYFLVVDDQHPPLLAQRRQFIAEVATQVHHWQQAATHVGHTLDPAFHPGQQGMTRLVQHFTDLPHWCDEQAFAHAKTNTAPGLHSRLLRRQASRQQSTTLVDF